MLHIQGDVVWRTAHGIPEARLPRGVGIGFTELIKHMEEKLHELVIATRRSIKRGSLLRQNRQPERDLKKTVKGRTAQLKAAQEVIKETYQETAGALMDTKRPNDRVLEDVTPFPTCPAPALSRSH